ncbi:hypothetical protein, partial [Bacillus pumilus]|uniref:hypothetical protein n=1 Tax=Bacillus pumilus TaxID=1408 RepID=UPI0011A21419
MSGDIGKVGEDALRKVEERGMMGMGGEVKEGEVVVGKVMGKGVREVRGEEGVLDGMFGEKGREVGDRSVRVGQGGGG